MKIICKDVEIRNVLDTGYYDVPRFQRAYSWERDHIVDFLNDTVVTCEEDYFIGSMVVFRENTGTFGIVDGQQRLTTITMILCALRDAYKAEDFEDLARGIHSLIERIDLDNNPRFVLQTETSYPYFQEYIQKYNEPEIEAELSQEEINLKNAFDLICRFITDEIESIKGYKGNKRVDIAALVRNRLHEMRDRILKLKVVLIELENEVDACTIFETMNTRGKDLSVGDLIKNHLLKHIKVGNRQVDLPKNKWMQIREHIDNAGDVDIDIFLLHVWLSRYEYTSLKTLYKKFKLTIKNNELKSFQDDLLNDARIYRSIFDPESHPWEKNKREIRNVLISLDNFHVTQQTPMVLAVLREHQNDRLKYKLTLDCLEAIEKFHYMYTAITSQRSSGGIASMYSSYARKLLHARDDQARNKVIQELKQKMREKVPTFDEFIAGFKKLKFINEFTKHKKTIQYTLSRIDSYYSKHGLVVDYTLMTIEHIYAQNPRKKSTLQDVPIGQIGNLILIDEKTNGGMGNKEFGQKKEVLTKAKIFIDDVLLVTETWGKEEIERRTELLGKLAYENVFRI